MSKSEKEWDLVINPKRDWWDIGASEIWQYRDLLLLFVKRDIVAFYKQTVLGPLWFFVQPIITMSIYMLVFSKLAGLSTDGLPGPIFYLIGITFWSYFSQTLLKSANTLRENQSIYRKVYFPRVIMPISSALSNLFRLTIQMSLLIVVVVYYVSTDQYEYVWSVNLALFPIMLLLCALQALGFGLVVTSLTTKYRDLALLFTFGVQLIMYATPVVYPLSQLEGQPLQKIVLLNPLTYIFEGIRFSLVGAGQFDVGTFGISILLTLTIFLSGIFVFNRVERSFVDTI